MISAILLAAGESNRMGQPKQLMPFGQSTIVERTLVGEKLVATSPVFLRRPLYYYATSAAIICVCLVISAVAVRAGL